MAANPNMKGGVTGLLSETPAAERAPGLNRAFSNLSPQQYAPVARLLNSRASLTELFRKRRQFGGREAPQRPPQTIGFGIEEE